MSDSEDPPPGVWWTRARGIMPRAEHPDHATASGHDANRPQLSSEEADVSFKEFQRLGREARSKAEADRLAGVGGSGADLLATDSPPAASQEPRRRPAATDYARWERIAAELSEGDMSDEDGASAAKAALASKPASRKPNTTIPVPSSSAVASSRLSPATASSSSSAAAAGLASVVASPSASSAPSSSAAQAHATGPSGTRFIPGKSARRPKGPDASAIARLNALTAAGNQCDRYLWSQTVDRVDLHVFVPRGTRASDVAVRVSACGLTVLYRYRMSVAERDYLASQAQAARETATKTEKGGAALSSSAAAAAAAGAARASAAPAAASVEQAREGQWVVALRGQFADGRKVVPEVMREAEVHVAGGDVACHSTGAGKGGGCEGKGVVDADAVEYEGVEWSIETEMEGDVLGRRLVHIPLRKAPPASAVSPAAASSASSSSGSASSSSSFRSSPEAAAAAAAAAATAAGLGLDATRNAVYREAVRAWTWTRLLDEEAPSSDLVLFAKLSVPDIARLDKLVKSAGKPEGAEESPA